MEPLPKELERLQQEQCLKCRYADKPAIGTGPCCTFGAGPMVKDGVCFAFATEGNDAEYLCRGCGITVRIKTVQGSLFATRQCPECYTNAILEYDGGTLRGPTSVIGSSNVD